MGTVGHMSEVTIVACATCDPEVEAEAGLCRRHAVQEYDGGVCTYHDPTPCGLCGEPDGIILIDGDAWHSDCMPWSWYTLRTHGHRMSPRAFVTAIDEILMALRHGRVDHAEIHRPSFERDMAATFAAMLPTMRRLQRRSIAIGMLIIRELDAHATEAAA